VVTERRRGLAGGQPRDLPGRVPAFLERGLGELPYRVRFGGTLAWLAWLALHIIELLGNRNRFSTLLNLSWRYLTWARGGGLIVGDDPPEEG
jgi:hypothetical protein